MIAVIKADAYGHGAVPVAHLIEDYDYIWGFAAATAEEAIHLREAGITKPILILGIVFDEYFPAEICFIGKFIYLCRCAGTNRIPIAGRRASLHRLCTVSEGSPIRTAKSGHRKREQYV